MPRVIPHPRAPGNPRWAILTDFLTNQAHLRSEHTQWLDRHVVSPFESGAGTPPWVFVRGFASRSGPRDVNERLSLRRAMSVALYLLEFPFVDPSRVQRLTGVAAEGEDWSGGPDDDNSERWRAVEVVVTPHRMPGERPVPIPPPRRTVRRRVSCHLIGGTPQMRGFRPEHGDDWARTGEALQRNSSADVVRRRLRCEFRDIPAHHRITRILVKPVTLETFWASTSFLRVKFVWGESAASTVALEWPGSSRPTRHLTRHKVAHLYSNVHLFLQTHDANYSSGGHAHHS